VRFCLVVPRYKKIQQMEQHCKLVKNEYKSERELMSGQKEIVVSAEEKSERVKEILKNFQKKFFLSQYLQLPAISAEITAISQVRSSLTSQKLKRNL